MKVTVPRIIADRFCCHGGEGENKGVFSTGMLERLVSSTSHSATLWKQGLKRKQQSSSGI